MALCSAGLPRLSRSLLSHPRARWGQCARQAGKACFTPAIHFAGLGKSGGGAGSTDNISSLRSRSYAPSLACCWPPLCPQGQQRAPHPPPRNASPPLHSPGGARNLLTPVPLESLNRRSGSDKVSSLTLGESNAQTALALDEVSSLRSIVYDPPTPLGCSPPLHKPRGGSQFSP